MNKLTKAAEGGVLTVVRQLLAGCLLLSGSCIAQVSDAEIQQLHLAMQAGQFGPVNSLLIQQSDQLLFEGYYRGTQRDDLQLLNSVTKSVGATLVGMAERRGLLNTSQTMQTLLPQYDWSAASLAPQAGLKLEHVLQMRHGLQWDEWSFDFTDSRNSAVMMFASSDWYRYTLSRNQIEAPGSRFRYSSGVSTLMSGVLRQATAQSPQSLFGQWLGAPLGIDSFRWELWSPNGPGTGIQSFPFGDAPLGVGLWLRPADLLALGELYLHGGVLDHGVGARLLDESWIERSWQRYSRNDNDLQFANASEQAGYGYQWWYRELLDARGRSHACWYADGAGRQYLIVCPKDELVVVSTGESYSYTGQGVFTLLRQEVLPRLNYPITAAVGGFYFDPASSGQGVSIEVIESTNQVLLAWYTFNQGQQRWYFTTGLIEDNAVNFDNVFRQEGGEFHNPNSGQMVHAGTARLVWDSCSQARLEYDLSVDGLQGSYALTRIAPDC